MSERGNHYHRPPEIADAHVVEYFVNRAIHGDREAFAELYDRYFDRIYAFVYHRVNDRDHAEDICATVWEKAYRAIPRYKQIGVPFVAWLYRIAGNELKNHYHRIHLQNIIRLVPQKLGFSEPHSEDRSDLEIALSQLSESDRQILSLRYWEDFGIEQICQILGINRDSANKRLSRARFRLEKELSQLQSLS